MKAASVEDPRFKTLGGALKDSVVLPGGAQYDTLRTPWLQVIEQHPALIVEAACVGDVVAAVNFARDESLALGVMSTGHGIAAACNGLLLRFSKMVDITIDASRKIATIGPGVLSSELLKAVEKHDLAYPAGQVGNVGVIGYALGGGTGWLVRKLGVAANWIVGADVVLGDGSLVRADAEHNPELFWALRGGGGNFGIVVSLEIGLTSMSRVVGGELYFPIERASELLRFYREWSSTLSDDTSTIFRVVAVPPGDMSPHEMRGKTVCMFGLCHTDPESSASVLDSLKTLGEPLRDDIKVRPLSSMAGLDPASHSGGAPAYGQMEHLKALSDDVMDGLGRLATTMIPPLMQFEIQQLGGALATISSERGGAFEPPTASYLLHLETPAVKTSMGEIAKATGDAFASLGDAYTGDKTYNFLRGDETPLVARAFGGRFARLRAAKRQFDPTNLFKLNVNVTPST